MELIHGMSFDDYRAIDAVNFSTLKHMADSPAHYRTALEDGFEQTPAMGKGIAIHASVLEPDSFPLRFVVWDGDRRGNAWKEFKAANANRDIITRAEYDLCLTIRDRVNASEDAIGLLYGRSEAVALWTDEATGIECKARFDHVNADSELIDLKMCPSTELFRFERHSADMAYHCQLAFYRRGLAAVMGTTVPRPRIIAAEWKPPHDVAVFRLTDDALYVGEQRVDEWLGRVALCRQTGTWPGRYTSEQDLTIPSWLLTDNDADGWGNLPTGGFDR